jgi:hypothetical protein
LRTDLCLTLLVAGERHSEMLRRSHCKRGGGTLASGTGFE